MKALDRWIQSWRIGKALPWVRQGDRLLDIGCFDPELLQRARPRLSRGLGLDPLATPSRNGAIEVIRGGMPDATRDMPDASFDCITMLAVLEHIPQPEAVAAECARLLTPGGRLVITVPRPVVDNILTVLGALRLIDGMSLEQHHGYDVDRTGPLFEAAGLTLHRRRSFQLGLNCLFVFTKPEAPPAAVPISTGGTARVA